MQGKSLGSTRNGFGFIQLILTIGLMFGVAHAHALTSTEYSFDEQVQQADLILVGTVSQINSFWGQGRGADTIFSNIQLIDLEQIKGQHPDSNYNLRVIGGIIGDQAQLYPAYLSLSAASAICCL